MRQAIIKRKTAETDIFLSLNLDGEGKSEINSGCGFLDHMLTLFAAHGKFDLTVKCIGDVEVDYHHTVEDIGIALGEAFSKALGDKKGICRYGEKVLVMDEALILAAIDFSGRVFLGFDAEMPTQRLAILTVSFVKNSGLALCAKAKAHFIFASLQAKTHTT